jgi:disulfide bond formation protein DsbB
MTESSEAAPTPGPEGGAEECATCITARGIMIALGFAAFAAYVAADFATGGRLTAVALGLVATLRGRVPPSSTTDG